MVLEWFFIFTIFLANGSTESLQFKFLDAEGCREFRDQFNDHLAPTPTMTSLTQCQTREQKK